jgi:phosphoribosylanthranilate isomerase
MVDVSGGVESAAGIKDQHKVAAFIDNAKNA